VRPRTTIKANESLPLQPGSGRALSNVEWDVRPTGPTEIRIGLPYYPFCGPEYKALFLAP